jgi:hypothetical protein
MSNLDEKVRYWVYNRPYVWKRGKDIKSCRRLYLLYNTRDDSDLIFVHTRKGYGSKKYNMKDRKIPFNRYNYVPEGNEKFCKVSLLDMWKDEKRMRPSSPCAWVARYFDVYIPERDGELHDLDVRINGKPFYPTNAYTANDYLRKANVVKGSPYFIRR